MKIEFLLDAMTRYGPVTKYVCVVNPEDEAIIKNPPPGVEIALDIDCPRGIVYVLDERAIEKKEMELELQETSRRV
jgi:hypothetical protein